METPEPDLPEEDDEDEDPLDEEDEDLIQATPEQFPRVGNWARQITLVCSLLALGVFIIVSTSSDKREKQREPVTRSETYAPTVEQMAAREPVAAPSDSGETRWVPGSRAFPPTKIRAKSSSVPADKPAVPELPAGAPAPLLEARTLLLKGAWPTDEQAMQMVLVYAFATAYADTARAHTRTPVDRLELKELKRLFLLALRAHEQSDLALLLEQADAGRK